ncbi:MAG: ABC transporter permease [Spirochaetes bacterium]|nr:ABC transporter permease [Spirochaetota bacterium]
MPKIFHVLRHEFKMAAANKIYVVLTILGPFLIFAVTVLPSLLTQSPGAMASGKPVAIVGAPPALYGSLSASFKSMGIEAGTAATEAEGKKAVLEAKIIGLVSIEAGWPDNGKAVWYSKTGSEASIYSAAQAVLAAAARETRIAASGMDPELVRKILAPSAFEVRKIEAGGKEVTKNEQSFLQILFTAMTFVMLLYMTVLLYGQLIGRSVVTEKTSKTVEIMLSSVTSRDLMFGKILGLGLAGLLQYGVWLSMAMVLIKLAGPLFGLAVPAGLTASNLLWLVLFFVLAFFLYASAYAALGAASEDEQHLGQLAWPLLIFLMVPLVMIGSFVTNPESGISVALSLFPMTSPIVMLIRILVSPPPAWQILLCIAILVVSVAAMATLAAKVFRVGILMTGKRAKLKEVLHWIAVK